MTKKRTMQGNGDYKVASTAAAQQHAESPQQNKSRANNRDAHQGQMRFFKSKETALAWGAAAAAMVSSAPGMP